MLRPADLDAAVGRGEYFNPSLTGKCLGDDNPEFPFGVMRFPWVRIHFFLL
jgi:hypothetical protein